MRAQPLALQASARPVTIFSVTSPSSGSGGEVVEEEERSGALHGDVVDAVVDQVGADGVVNSEFEGDLELGANTVCTGDQDRLLVA